MKYLNLALVFLFFFASCSENQKKPDCSKLRTGKFEYRGGFGNKHFIIERSDSMQTERDEDTGIILKLKIEWTGDCDYKLTLLSVNINGKDSMVDKSAFPPIMTTIQTTTRGYYTCRSVAGDNLVHADTMIILKPGS